MEHTKKISLVAARFSPSITDNMVKSAIDEAKKYSAEVVRVVRVAGSYEMPLAMKKVISKGDSEAVVALAYIERGETLHGEIMGHIVHGELVKMSLEHNIPLGIGIIGPGATMEQAIPRWDSYARAAVRAALALCDDLLFE